MLTMEEHAALSRAYELVSRVASVPSSHWHRDESWLNFTHTVTQRLDSAASRTVSVCGATDTRSWIPTSHHLVGAEEIVYHICTLFKRFAFILKTNADERNFSWNECAVAINNALHNFAEVLFTHPRTVDSTKTFPSTFLLEDGIHSLPGDQYTRQLLTLYYIFQLQYYIIVSAWSDTLWRKALGTALAISCLYPPPHESHYPTPEMRFIANRGFFFALIFVADSKTFKRMIIITIFN
jgi:hypothetical protein